MCSPTSLFLDMNHIICLEGKIYSLSEPVVMGIINATPDSFFDGGRLKSDNDLLNKAETTLMEGAFILDIGGYSTRPGAENIPMEIEIRRVANAIEVIKKKFPDAKISVDTFRSQVARAAIECGACMVNDVSGGRLDTEMHTTVAAYKAAYVLMHMRGNPQTMQVINQYTHVTADVFFELSQAITNAISHGIKDIMVDVGFGFAKNLEQNYELLKNLSYFKKLDFPLLVGVSRKSMIYKQLNCTPEDALNGTTALHMAALSGGANMLRVHDVKPAMETIRLYTAMVNSSNI